ncbi:MAG: hypothetical protein IKC31_00630 [Clostridia bacterium]|nr:hypothetical protein [Clostridia bacterium]
MKRILSAILVIFLVVTTLAGCSSTKKETEFYDLVVETQELLEEYATDILDCWSDHVHDKKYATINLALSAAKRMNSDTIEAIEANHEIIQSLCYKIKNGKLKAEIKNVFLAYDDYYTFVMDAGGSYNSFSEKLPEIEKVLSDALKSLKYEL